MSIQEFFTGSVIFVTGATGFMGKVLIEKLVRSCPNISKICVLVRHKKGKDKNDRIKEILNVKLFDTIKEQKPGLIEEKLIPILGDMTELRLGISEEDYNFLVNNVTVVFHVAASVRFDEPIQDATIMNVRGTREVVQLAKQMKNLAVLLHVSTAYCNCIRQYVEEKVYESPCDWRDVISVAENFDQVTSSILTKKFLGPFPNTYTLTKQLAEQIINEERYNIPVVIFRPTIVISSHEDPIKGWIDNFNGPIGLLMACGKGILQITYTDESIVPDYMAVDISIKSMIVAAWHRSKSNSLEDNPIPVYNSASVSKSISNKDLLKDGMRALEKYPFEECLWYPSIKITTCFYYYYIVTILRQVLPALFIDALLDLMGKSHKRLLRLQQKIYIMTMALTYFTTKMWTFENTNFLGLINKIPDTDRKEFNYDFKDIDINEFIKNAILGSQKYLFNVDHKRLPIARKIYRRFVWIDLTIKTIGLAVLIWTLVQFNVIPRTLFRSVLCYFNLV